MASSYSTDLKLELMVTGENAGTWGDNTNNNLNLIQQAIAGYEAIALTDGGTVTLAMTDKTISNARNMVIKFTGTLTTASTVTIPDSIEKFYIFDLSAVVGVTNLTIKTVSGTGFTAGEAKIVAAYSDGTNLNEIALNTLGGTIGTAQIDDNSITAAKISNNAVTTNKILASNVTTNKLAASAVTANNIANSTITQAKLATDSVGPDQLISTGVTAGAYTTASITVDADGRITAASSGVAGSKPYIYTDGAYGLSTGQGPFTFTAQPTTTNLALYLVGGGGGGGAGPVQGSNGGVGGFGYFSIPVSAPYSQPFTVGGEGPGAVTYGAGTAGGNTTFGSPVVATATGGSGGSSNSPLSGASGTAPGATVDLSIAITPGIPIDDQSKLATRRLMAFFSARRGQYVVPTSATQGPQFATTGIGGVGTNVPNTAASGMPGTIQIYENIGD